MARHGIVTLGLLVLLAPSGCTPECKLVRHDATGQNPDTTTVESDGGNCTFYTYATSDKDSVGTKPGGN